MKKTARGKPGPEADTLKIEGVDWESAVKTAVTKKRPASGWPKPPRRAKKKPAPKK